MFRKGLCRRGILDRNPTLAPGLYARNDGVRGQFRSTINKMSAGDRFDAALSGFLKYVIKQVSADDAFLLGVDGQLAVAVVFNNVDDVLFVLRGMQLAAMCAPKNNGRCRPGPLKRL